MMLAGDVFFLIRGLREGRRIDRFSHNGWGWTIVSKTGGVYTGETLGRAFAEYQEAQYRR